MLLVVATRARLRPRAAVASLDGLLPATRGAGAVGGRRPCTRRALFEGSRVHYDAGGDGLCFYYGDANFLLEPMLALMAGGHNHLRGNNPEPMSRVGNCARTVREWDLSVCYCKLYRTNSAVK